MFGDEDLDYPQTREQEERELVEGFAEWEWEQTREDFKRKYGNTPSGDVVDPEEWKEDLEFINKNYEGKVFIDIHNWVLVNVDRLGQRTETKLDCLSHLSKELLFKSIGLNDNDLEEWKKKEEEKKAKEESEDCPLLF